MSGNLYISTPKSHFITSEVMIDELFYVKTVELPFTTNNKKPDVGENPKMTKSVIGFIVAVVLHQTR